MAGDNYPPTFCLSSMIRTSFHDSLPGSPEQYAQATHSKGPSYQHFRQVAQQQLGIQSIHHLVIK